MELAVYRETVSTVRPPPLSNKVSKPLVVSLKKSLREAYWAWHYHHCQLQHGFYVIYHLHRLRLRLHHSLDHLHHSPDHLHHSLDHPHHSHHCGQPVWLFSPHTYSSSLHILFLHLIEFAEFVATFSEPRSRWELRGSAVNLPVTWTVPGQIFNAWRARCHCRCSARLKGYKNILCSKTCG